MTMIKEHRQTSAIRPERPQLTVVGVGDTDRDDAAVAWAIAQAGQDDVVHLVHAYLPLHLVECTWPPVVASRDARRTAARVALARVLQRTRAQHPDVHVEGSVVAGLTADVLIEFSAVVDRIVVTEDRENASMLHQVAHRLAGSARCPTVVVSPAFDPAVVSDTAPVTLLADSTVLPEVAVEFAYAAAVRKGVPLCVAQAWATWPDSCPIMAESIAERQQLLDEQLVRFEQPVGVLSQLIRDDIDTAVAELRKASSSLVVGSNLGHLGRLTGPSAPGSAPLIVVPEPSER